MTSCFVSDCLSFLGDLEGDLGRLGVNFNEGKGDEPRLRFVGVIGTGLICEDDGDAGGFCACRENMA